MRPTMIFFQNFSYMKSCKALEEDPKIKSKPCESVRVWRARWKLEKRLKCGSDFNEFDVYLHMQKIDKKENLKQKKSMKNGCQEHLQRQGWWQRRGNVRWTSINS